MHFLLHRGLIMNTTVVVKLCDLLLSNENTQVTMVNTRGQHCRGSVVVRCVYVTLAQITVPAWSLDTFEWLTHVQIPSTHSGGVGTSERQW